MTPALITSLLAPFPRPTHIVTHISLVVMHRLLLRSRSLETCGIVDAAG